MGDFRSSMTERGTFIINGSSERALWFHARSFTWRGLVEMDNGVLVHKSRSFLARGAWLDLRLIQARPPGRLH